MKRRRARDRSRRLILPHRPPIKTKAAAPKAHADAVQVLNDLGGFITEADEALALQALKRLMAHKASDVMCALVVFVRDMNLKNVGRNARLDTLEQEGAETKSALAILDAKALKGGLPWARGTTYVGDCVQHDGGLWRCVETHVSGASFGHHHFLLQIKRGRDGKDAR